MEVPSPSKAFAKLHISIVLAGFTAIFGKLITLQEGPLVWYRLLIAFSMFYGYLLYTKSLPKTIFREKIKIASVGIITALHWLFFYGSIKYANISIGVVCFALTGFFTAILEPFFNKTRISIRELFFSLFTVCGIALIFHFDTRYHTGIILGVISALCAALFTIAIKRVGSNHAASTMLFYQLVGGLIFLSCIAPLYLMLFPYGSLLPNSTDFMYLLVFSSLCTIGMFLLQIQALQHISAFTVNLSYNLEPIYSIILAMVFFNEANELNSSFFIGLGLICLSVLLQSMYAIRSHKVSPATSTRAMD